jgi:hypothetical protein
MDWQAYLDKLLAPARPLAVIGSGLAILAGLYTIPSWLDKKIAEDHLFGRELRRILEQTSAAREHMGSLEALKTTDLEQLKAGISGNALTQKSLFESGLSLQEERRLLEKQLEIMTTSLLVNPALQRIFLMRAEQPLQSYLISYIPVRSFGGAPTTLPPNLRVISKERFAHPERGKSEEVNGTLQWVPPQVGTSVRSKALGEFVMFTNSALIIHGPPLSEEDHEKYPHICLGIDQDAARKLYRASFIGTHIVLSHVSIEKSPTSVVPSTPAVPSPSPEPH